MAKNNNQPLLKNGSTGSDVKKLQQSLIDAGYDVGKTGADGIYGPKTTEAVRQYQKDNGLSVDGIAGPKTMGSMYGNGSVQTTGKPDLPPVENKNGAGNGASAGGQQEPTAGTEQPPATSNTTSDVVTAANQALANWQKSSYGPYYSQFQDEMDYYLGKYKDRGPFSYDFNQDALYQMYKDQYIQLGQMAMMDTMGQAAAMTGGYGNSYAQTVGQQVYNQQLSQLNNIIPDLYQMAYNRYNQEGQDMLNMYNMYADREAMEFNKYQAGLENWWRQGEFLAGQASTAWEQDRLTNLDAYNQGRDAIGDAQWQAEFDRKGQLADKEYLTGMIANYGYDATDEELAAAGITRAEADALKKAYTASLSNGSGGSGGNEAPDYEAMDFDTIQKWEKKFGDATSYSQLENIGWQMQDSGIDPQIVARWVAYYAKLLGLVPDAPSDPTDPNYYGGGAGANGGGGKYGSHGGGGGGRWLMEAY